MMIMSEHAHYSYYSEDPARGPLLGHYKVTCSQGPKAIVDWRKMITNQ